MLDQLRHIDLVLAAVSVVADRKIGARFDLMFTVRVQDKDRVILLAASLHGGLRVYKGSHLVIADDILAPRSDGDQLLDEDIHFFVCLITLHDPVAGTGRHFLQGDFSPGKLAGPGNGLSAGGNIIPQGIQAVNLPVDQIHFLFK